MIKFEERKPTDAVLLLETDHENVKSLFDEYERAGRDRKAAIANRIFDELEIHTKVEQEILFPAIATGSRNGARTLVERAIREHAQTLELILALRDRRTGDPGYDAMMKDLRRDVEHHIEEDEDEVLPLAEKMSDGSLLRLGERIKERKVLLSGLGGASL